MARISIVIPRHDETEQFMRPLFTSIDNQIGIDFNNIEVLVVNDIPTNVITDFSCIQNYQPKNLFNRNHPGNMGISRQIGIDNATGDFLLFCDADDILHSCGVLNDYFNRANSTVENEQFDILITNFIEESRVPGTNQPFFSPHSQDFTWMFAKLYRRDYIIRNNIRFHNDLLVHEDSYFNCLFRAYNCRVMFNDWPSYIWKFNPKSITRKQDADYSYNSLCIFIDAIEKAIQEIQRRNVANITDNVVQLMCN